VTPPSYYHLVGSTPLAVATALVCVNSTPVFFEEESHKMLKGFIRLNTF